MLKETVNTNTSEWELDGHHVRCSACGSSFCYKDLEGDKIPLNFCPSCGMKMKPLGLLA